MCSYCKNKDLLKFQPFYTSKIKKSTKKTRITKNVTKKPTTITSITISPKKD